VKRFIEWYPDGVAVLVDTRKSGLADAVVATAPINVKKLAKQLANAMFKDLSQISHFGRFLAEAATSIPRYVRAKGVKRIFVVIDEVTTALTNVEAYAKSMESTMNVGRPEELRDVIVNFFALTSEGYSRDLLARHSYVWQAYVWNLPKRDFEELYYRARELWPGQAPPFEDVWAAFGGNPRALRDLAERYKWDFGEMKRSLLQERIRDVARLLEQRRDSVLEAVEDVDYLRRDWELRDVLIRHNLVMDVLRGLELGRELGAEPPPADRELGIGEDYAWQMPIYRELVREALRQGPK